MLTTIGKVTMNTIVTKYLNRNSIKQKVTVEITDELIRRLQLVVDEYRDDVFNRIKSPLTSRTINDTIPTMINNDIKDIVENLKRIPTVARNSLEHYKLLYGDNATGVYAIRAKRCSTSLESFIIRHGETLGLQKYNDFIVKSRDQNTLEGFISRHGDSGHEKFAHYIERCSYTNTLAYYIEVHGEDAGFSLYRERYPTNGDTFKDYKNAVHRASHKTYLNNKQIINPHNHPRTRMGVDGGWQLDHIKPVAECFQNGISVTEASHVDNLRMLPWLDNLMRNYNKND